ncbi:MAG: hypothetical protein ACXWB9_04055 [Flavisolibacter sp.]
MDKQSVNKPQQQADQPVDQVSGKNDGLAKNPNPRANENINTEDQNPERTQGAGSEITDGEAG